MTPEVEICNLALSHIGEPAYVASIEPPEGSEHAELCARFYPKARDSLLEMHTWGFATATQALATLAAPRPGWRHTYSQPADVIRVLEVLPPDASDQPQDYAVEASLGGAYPVICTNQANAVVRYIAHSPYSHTYPPLFTLALSWHLAGMLAGPILKGDVGAAEAKRCMQMMAHFMGQAAMSDANQHQQQLAHKVAWLEARN